MILFKKTVSMKYSHNIMAPLELTMGSMVYWQSTISVLGNNTFSTYFQIVLISQPHWFPAAVGPSLGVVAAMHSGCSSTPVVAFFTLGMALMGFYYPSLSVNTLDLSPNYSGTLMGLIALGGMAGILSPYLAGIIAPQVRLSYSIILLISQIWQ